MDLLVGSLKTFGSQVASLVVSFVTSIFLARLLGPEGNGQYAIIILVPLILQLLGTVGLPAAIVYYGARAEHPPAELASTAIVLSFFLGFGIIAVFGLVTLHNSYQSLLTLFSVNHLALLFAVLSVLPYLVFQFSRQFLRSQERVDLFNGLTVLEVTVKMIGISILLLISEAKVQGAVLGYFSGSLIAATVAIWVLNKSTPLAPFRLFRWDLTKKLFRFGFQSYLGSIFQLLNYRIDLFIVTVFAGVAASGYYAAAITLAERLLDFPNAIRVVLQPRVAAVSEEKAVALTSVFSRNTLVITGLAALVFGFFAGPVLTILFGPEYLPSRDALLWLLPGMVLMSANVIIAAFLPARGNPIYPSLVAVASLLVNIPLNLWLIPRMGIVGASIASSVTYSISTALIIRGFLRYKGASIAGIFLVTAQDLSSIQKTIAHMAGQLRERLIR